MYLKYLKYKKKYLKLKKLIGGEIYQQDKSIQLFVRFDLQFNLLYKIREPNFSEKLKEIPNVLLNIENISINSTLQDLIKLIEIKLEEKYKNLFESLNFDTKIQNIKYNNKSLGNIDKQTLAHYNIQSNDFILIQLCEKKTIYDELYNLLLINEDIEKIYNFYKNNNKENIKKLIIDYRNQGDHNKTFIHFIARFGKFKLLRFIKNILDEEEFKNLISVPDDENRIPLMMAIRSIGGLSLENEKKKDLENIIILLIDNMDKEKLEQKTIQGFNSLHHAIYYKIEDNLIQKIYDNIDDNHSLNYIKENFNEDIYKKK
jgi:hypothetical protein